MQNADIAKVLSELADLLELTGENQFKVRAYRRAAAMIDLHPAPLDALWRAGRLTELPGTDVACRLAKQASVPVVISSDAHHASQLANLRYGVWVARRGWLEARDVWNTLPLPELRRRLARRRHGPRAAAR